MRAFFEDAHRLIDEYMKDCGLGKKVEFPFSNGVCKAIRAYDEKSDWVILNEFLWEDEISDFVDALRKAGIESFILADIRSTALMDDIFGFVENGCVLSGLVTVIKDMGYGMKELKGIKFTVEVTK